MTDQTSTNDNALARARAEHATPTPQPGEVWRARWEERAGAVLVLTLTAESLHLAPVSFDEQPDETATLSPAPTNTLNVDLAIWAADDARVPLCVLDYKLGQLTEQPRPPQRVSTNWGPTDPRTLARARAQDLVEALRNARWAPTARTDFDLRAAIAAADVQAVATIVGSVGLAAALRRGQQVPLGPKEALKLAALLDVPTEDVVAAAQPPLPDDLVTAMDAPGVRSLVDQLAQRRGTGEVDTWRYAAYGVVALAAREHDRRTAQWSGRIRAYFEAQLRDTTSEADQ